MDEQNKTQNTGNAGQAQNQAFEQGVPTTKSQVIVDKGMMEKYIKPEVQDMINKPQIDPTGVDEQDSQFMELVVKLINDGTINIHAPSTLMNNVVYDNLDDEKQGKADMNAISLLIDLQQIKQLFDAGDTESFQIQNLVHRVRLAKERLEEDCGDVYII